MHCKKIKRNKLLNTRSLASHDLCVYASVRVCECVCFFARVCVIECACVRVCLCIYVTVWMRVRACVQVYDCVYARVCVCKRALVCEYVLRVCEGLCKQVRKCVFAHMRVFMYASTFCCASYTNAFVNNAHGNI